MNHKSPYSLSCPGFTLAELLIALAILGVIATFTIPKVLESTNTSQQTAIAKEAASMVSGGFSALKQAVGVTAATTEGAITPYLNYVRVDTTTNLTNTNGPATECFTANVQCLQLHNGGFLAYDTTANFQGTSSTHALYFNVDPDGAGVAEQMTFVLMYNGRFTTGANAGAAGTGHIAPDAVGVALDTTDAPYLLNWN